MSLIFLLVFLFSIAIAPAAYAAGGIFGNSDSTDIGTESNPYLIDDEADLKKFRDIVNDGSADAHAKLTKDITLEDEWMPIGNDDSTQYTGTFDGGGHAISGLSVNGTKYLGFFGYVGGGGVVKNLTIASGTVRGGTNMGGGDDVGGIAGWNDGTVENCANSADVSGYSYVGGIVGYNCAIVQNCTNSGKVSATGNVGGIAGGNYKSTVKNCINSGDVSATRYVGGIVGDNEGGTVENCANSADVSGSSYVGGIVGLNNASTEQVQNCAYLNQGVSYNSGIGEEDDPGTVVPFDTIDDMNSKLVMTLSASIDRQSVYTGETATITFSTSPALASSLSGVFDTENGALRSGGVTIESGDSTVAEAVYNGDGTITVTGLSEGETAITVKATFYATDLSTLSNNQPSYLDDDGTELTFSFNLTVSNIALQSISIPETAEVQVGKTTTLTVTYTPKDATNQTVTWESSDSAIATVDEKGIVTGVNAGTATITATPEDTTGGATEQTCIVTVTDRSTEQDEDDSTTKSGGSGGGCNAGTGALALLALIPLALRRKR